MEVRVIWETSIIECDRSLIQFFPILNFLSTVTYKKSLTRVHFPESHARVTFYGAITQTPFQVFSLSSLEFISRSFPVIPTQYPEFLQLLMMADGLCKKRGILQVYSRNRGSEAPWFEINSSLIFQNSNTAPEEHTIWKDKLNISKGQKLFFFWQSWY